jgi:hypothetical protein
MANNVVSVAHMKRQTLTLITLLALGFCSFANANLVSLTYAQDGTGALNYNYGTWNFGGTADDAEVNISGDQFGLGSMLGYLVADSASDPSLKFHTTIGNSSGVDWTNYDVTVFLSQPFTITNPIVFTPSDWTIQYSPIATWNGSAYEGNILFFGGTPVSGSSVCPGTLDIAYKIIFSGSTTYTLSQEMIPNFSGQDINPNPVPEPGTAGLLGMGGLLYGLIKRRVYR